jgi:hypothetical protein
MSFKEALLDCRMEDLPPDVKDRYRQAVDAARNPDVPKPPLLLFCCDQIERLLLFEGADYSAEMVAYQQEILDRSRLLILRDGRSQMPTLTDRPTPCPAYKTIHERIQNQSLAMTDRVTPPTPSLEWSLYCIRLLVLSVYSNLYERPGCCFDAAWAVQWITKGAWDYASRAGAQEAKLNKPTLPHETLWRIGARERGKEMNWQRARLADWLEWAAGRGIMLEDRRQDPSSLPPAGPHDPRKFWREVEGEEVLFGG